MLWVGLPILLVSVAASAGGDWNDKGIAWKDYAAGLAEAKVSRKPVCLIFFTEWCPHCTNYAKVFHDPKVVAASRGFVMIRLNKDDHPELSRTYKPDGEYIPRTFFLAASGVLLNDIHAPRTSYRYFYSESDPASVLGGMAAAKLKP